MYVVCLRCCDLIYTDIHCVAADGSASMCTQIGFVCVLCSYCLHMAYYLLDCVYYNEKGTKNSAHTEDLERSLFLSKIQTKREQKINVKKQLILAEIVYLGRLPKKIVGLYYRNSRFKISIRDTNFSIQLFG